MGAAAFLMVEYVDIPCFERVKTAFLSTIISYIALVYIVHLDAIKLNMRGLERVGNGHSTKDVLGYDTFTATAVSGGNPIRTGFIAVSYSLRTALLPFLFIFNNYLPLIYVTLLHGIMLFISSTAAI
ncbi:hypothetical protein ACWU4D_10505 [Vibrio sp. WJH972]